MAGKCNLLKPIDCTTGTFLMFSQYAQDLTRAYTQEDNYRVVPSKYAALNLNIGSMTSCQLGQIFQNYFENACTNIRPNDQWDPTVSLPLVWRALENYGLIEITEEEISSGNVNVCDQLKFIGDINIYSYNPTSDGIGYNEIYCYIPNSAKSTSYYFNNYSKFEDLQYNLTDDVKSISGYATDDYEMTYTGLHWLLVDEETSDPMLEYYDKVENNNSSESSSVSNITRCYIPVSNVPDVLADSLVDDETDSEKTARMSNFSVRKDENGDPLASFEFNAVLVMYDIVSKGTEESEDYIVYHNVPLGIYFTGTPVGDGSLTNTVTKFVNNEDIYNQGTSYGLRICTRYLCMPNLTKIESTEVITLDNDEEITQVLSAVAENNALFKDLSEDINELSEGITNHLYNFRNNKVNVPYVRKVDGSYYWFVNGKNTGVSASTINQSDVDELIRRLDEIDQGLEEKVEEVIEEKLGDIMSVDDSDIDSIINEFSNRL